MVIHAGQATVAMQLGTDSATTIRHSFRVQRADIGNAAEIINNPTGTIINTGDHPFELAAGASVRVATRFEANSNIATPSAGDIRCWVELYVDRSSTLLRSVQVVTLPGGAGGYPDTHGEEIFYATSDGTSTGTPKAGTYRLVARMEYAQNTADSVNGGYRVNSDETGVSPLNARSGTTNTWASGRVRTDMGYLRAGVNLTAIDIDNSAAFDGLPALFAWPDTVRLRVTTDVTILTGSSTLIIDADTLNVATPIRDSEIVASAASTTWNDSGGTVQLDRTDPASFGIQIGPPDNSTLSGRPWVHFESVPVSYTLGTVDGTKSISASRQSFLTFDSSITVDHHMQLNNNVFNVALDTVSRLTSDLAFITLTLTNARGEPVNGVTVTETLQDNQVLTTAAIDRSVATGANGRPSTMSSWSSSLPGGGWLHTVDITSPSGLIGEEVTPVVTYTLLAPNSAYSVLCSAGGATDGQHFNQGDDFIAGGGLVNGVTGQLLTPSGTPCAIIARQSDTGYVEYLDDTFAWNQLDGSEAAFCHDLMSSDLIIPGADPRVFLLIIPASVGVVWGLGGISCLFRFLDAAGTPYIGQASVFVSGGKNLHSGYKFDPIGLFK